MDKTTCYRQLIRRLLLEKEALFRKFDQKGHETYCVLDDERGQYLIMNTGWEGGHRLRDATLYIRLQDGKFWIEEDWTEYGIANELVDEGVPREDIVLGFQAPEMRPYTDFAVA